jgi:hypothetical protein
VGQFRLPELPGRSIYLRAPECNITTMTDEGGAPTEPWYRARPKNLAIFALIWSGEALLILKFVKWVIHGSAALYLLIIPWMLFGSIIVLRPNWIMSMTRTFEGELGRSDKWIPPGFP